MESSGTDAPLALAAGATAAPLLLARRSGSGAAGLGLIDKRHACGGGDKGGRGGATGATRGEEAGEAVEARRVH